MSTHKVSDKNKTSRIVQRYLNQSGARVKSSLMQESSKKDRVLKELQTDRGHNLRMPI